MSEEQEKKGNKSLQMILVLMGVIVVATAVLQGVDSFTAEIIARNQNLTVFQGTLSVLAIEAPDGDYETRFQETVEVKDVTTPGPLRTVYIGRLDGEVVGYAARMRGGGFQGVVDIIVGFTPDLGQTTGFEVVESGETPGLGAEMATCNDQYCFKEQFYDGVATEPKLDYIKYRAPEKDNQFEAITGATFTSTAIRDFTNKALAHMRGMREAGEL